MTANEQVIKKGPEFARTFYFFIMPWKTDPS